VGTAFGAGDLQTLVAKLNNRAPRMEQSIQDVRGNVMIVECRAQQLAACVAVELTNIIVAFRNEFDTQIATIIASEEVLRKY
jgi:hypothetical protein